MAGDVYSKPPYVGRGGWSWYTGSAAWLHRGALESICGLRVRGGRISLTPHLPPHWPRIQIRLRLDGRSHEFIVCAAWAKDEIEQATTNGAIPLPESEWLVLDEAGEASRHLIVTTGRVPLTDRTAHVESPSEVGP
jgi:cyclic beta-1,2-glucan synthetase